METRHQQGETSSVRSRHGHPPSQKSYLDFELTLEQLEKVRFLLPPKFFLMDPHSWDMDKACKNKSEETYKHQQLYSDR